MVDKISLKNIQIFAYHGVFEEEQKLGQKFIISVDLFANLSKIGTTDSLDDGLCYAKVIDQIVTFCTKNRFNTLEGLSHALGKYLFLTNKMIENIQIKVDKPNAPVNHPIDTISVEIQRKRSDYEPMVQKVGMDAYA